VLQHISPPRGRIRISADGYLVTLAPLFGPVLSIEEPLGVYRMHDQNAWARRESAAAERFRHSLLQDVTGIGRSVRRPPSSGSGRRDDPGMHDWLHLENRICRFASTLRAPSEPDAGFAGPAGVRGELARWNLEVTRRVMLAAWFLLVGLLPRRAALALVVWRMAPNGRPRLLTALLRRVRGQQRHAPRVT